MKRTETVKPNSAARRLLGSPLTYLSAAGLYAAASCVADAPAHLTVITVTLSLAIVRSVWSAR